MIESGSTLGTYSKRGGLKSWYIWIISVLILVCGSNLQVAYSVVNELIRSEFNLTVGQVTFAASVHMWVFSICQFFTGAILDYTGEKRTLSLSMVFILVGTFILSNCYSFVSLVLSQIILAVGTSFGFIGSGYVSGKHFAPCKFGIMFGLAQAFYSIASLAGQSACAILIELNYDWRQVINFMLYFCMLVLIMTSLFFQQIKFPDDSRKKSFPFKILIKKVIDVLFIVLKIKNIWLTAFAGSMSFGIFLSVGVFWGPRLLSANLTESQAGIATSFVWLGLAVGAPVSNWISSLIGNRRYVIIVFYLVQALSISILLYGQIFYINACMLMLIFGFASGSHMINFAVGSDLVQQEYIGTSASIINGFMSVISGIIIFLTSFVVLDNTVQAYQDLAVIIALIIMMACFLIYIMPETYGKPNTEKLTC